MIAEQQRLHRIGPNLTVVVVGTCQGCELATMGVDVAGIVAMNLWKHTASERDTVQRKEVKT